MMIKETMQQRQQEVLEGRRVLHLSRDDATGRALYRLLTIHLEQSRVKLESATGDALIRIQGEVAAYRKMIALQQDPEITLQP